MLITSLKKNQKNFHYKISALLIYISHVVVIKINGYSNFHSISSTTYMEKTTLKGARSDCFWFFQPFGAAGISCWYQKKAGEFYSWKMYRLEAINENVTSYGNHN